MCQIESQKGDMSLSGFVFRPRKQVRSVQAVINEKEHSIKEKKDFKKSGVLL